MRDEIFGALDEAWVPKNRLDAWFRRELDAPPADRDAENARDRGPLLDPTEQAAFLEHVADAIDAPRREPPAGKREVFDARAARASVKRYAADPWCKRAPVTSRLRLETAVYRRAKRFRAKTDSRPGGRVYAVVTASQPADRVVVTLEEVGTCELIELDWSLEQQRELGALLERASASELASTLDTMLRSVVIVEKVPGDLTAEIDEEAEDLLDLGQAGTLPNFDDMDALMEAAAAGRLE